MTDPSRYPDPASDTRRRWVKVFLVVILVLVVAAVILMVAGGGGHGPSRHF